MSALASFATAFAASALAQPLARAFQRRLNAREPPNRYDLRTSIESKVTYWSLAGLMLVASIASLRADGAWVVTSVFTFPLMALFVFLAWGAHRLRLRTLDDGFEYTGLTGSAHRVRWNEIKKIEWDGPWWAIYSREGGRLLVSRSFIGIRYFAKDLVAHVSVAPMSPLEKLNWDSILGKSP